MLCVWKPPHLCVGSTLAACAGRGVWGREVRAVFVGALCRSTEVGWICACSGGKLSRGSDLCP